VSLALTQAPPTPERVTLAQSRSGARTIFDIFAALRKSDMITRGFESMGKVMKTQQKISRVLLSLEVVYKKLETEGKHPPEADTLMAKNIYDSSLKLKTLKSKTSQKIQKEYRAFKSVLKKMSPTYQKKLRGYLFAEIRRKLTVWKLGRSLYRLLAKFRRYNHRIKLIAHTPAASQKKFTALLNHTLYRFTHFSPNGLKYKKFLDKVYSLKSAYTRLKSRSITSLTSLGIPLSRLRLGFYKNLIKDAPKIFGKFYSLKNQPVRRYVQYSRKILGTLKLYDSLKGRIKRLIRVNRV
jgi:hypothetical protein